MKAHAVRRHIHAATVGWLILIAILTGSGTALGSGGDGGVSEGLDIHPQVAAAEVDRILANAPVMWPMKRLWGGNDVKYLLTLDNGSPNGLKTLFRPDHLADPGKPQREVAAYRVARESGIGHVPPAVLRTLPITMLSQYRTVDLARLKIVGNHVSGSVQIFVDGARPAFQEGGAVKWRNEWAARLRRAVKQKIDRGRAVVFESLILLDYLVGNGDRFSGGNLLADGQGRMWFIDNVAIFHNVQAPVIRFNKLRRFPSRLIAKIRRYTPDAIRSSLKSLLKPWQVQFIVDRRAVLLKKIGNLVDKYGSDSVLF